MVCAPCSWMPHHGCHNNKDMFWQLCWQWESRSMGTGMHADEDWYDWCVFLVIWNVHLSSKWEITLSSVLYSDSSVPCEPWGWQHRGWNCHFQWGASQHWRWVNYFVDRFLGWWIIVTTSTIDEGQPTKVNTVNFPLIWGNYNSKKPPQTCFLFLCWSRSIFQKQKIQNVSCVFLYFSLSLRYNVSTGIYTVMFGGLYLITSTLLVNSAHFGIFYIRHNDQDVCLLWIEFNDSGASDTWSVSCSATVYAAPGRWQWPVLANNPQPGNANLTCDNHNMAKVAFAFPGLRDVC